MTVLYRNIVPLLGNEYNIEATMGSVGRVFSLEDRGFEFPWERFMTILQLLANFRFINSEIDFIPDIMNGVLVQTDVWFQAYGEVYGAEGQHPHAYDMEFDEESINTADTWSISDVDTVVDDEDEHISDTEVDEIMATAHWVRDLVNEPIGEFMEVIDLTNEHDEIIDLTDDNEQ